LTNKSSNKLSKSGLISSITSLKSSEYEYKLSAAIEATNFSDLDSVEAFFASLYETLLSYFNLRASTPTK